jgi:hypothetical protein
MSTWAPDPSNGAHRVGIFDAGHLICPDLFPHTAPQLPWLLNSWPLGNHALRFGGTVGRLPTSPVLLTNDTILVETQA